MSHTIYVGNLDLDIQEDFIDDIFSDFGEIRDIKIIRDPESQVSRGYCFITYEDKSDAYDAIQAMTEVPLPGRERPLRVNHAQRKSSIYIGNLDYEATEDDVVQEFSQFGEIDNVKILRHLNGGSKGVCFITYLDPYAAKAAIDAMDGQVLPRFPGRCLRVNTTYEKKKQGSMPSFEYGVPQADQRVAPPRRSRHAYQRHYFSRLVSESAEDSYDMMAR